MSIEDMVTEGLGLVTDEDRQKWEQHKQAMAAEKAERARRAPGKAIVNGLSQSMMQYAEKTVSSQLRAEDQFVADNRSVKKRRVLEESTETIQVGDGEDSYEFGG